MRGVFVRLLHYTKEPFVFDRSRTYPSAGVSDKPRGLWVSVEGEDDWSAWCVGESFALESLAHCAEVTLSPEAEVEIIERVDQLDAFYRRFRVTDDPLEIRAIDWGAVRDCMQGVIIAPYQWERRLDLMWYYVWDCASGVIWNLAAVADVRAVELEKAA